MDWKWSISFGNRKQVIRILSNDIIQENSRRLFLLSIFWSTQWNMFPRTKVFIKEAYASNLFCQKLELLLAILTTVKLSCCFCYYCTNMLLLLHKLTILNKKFDIMMRLSSCPNIFPALQIYFNFQLSQVKTARKMTLLR